MDKISTIMAEVIYRIKINRNIIEHRAKLTENHLNEIIPATITVLRAEWQEEAIEQALKEYLK